VSLKRYRQGRREIPVPGQSVQVEGQHLKLAGCRFYQFTAIDEATRYRVLRLYADNSIKSATDFVEEVRCCFPSPSSGSRLIMGPNSVLISRGTCKISACRTDRSRVAALACHLAPLGAPRPFWQHVREHGLIQGEIGDACLSRRFFS
jgi:hypothetical protein